MDETESTVYGAQMLLLGGHEIYVLLTHEQANRVHDLVGVSSQQSSLTVEDENGFDITIQMKYVVAARVLEVDAGVAAANRVTFSKMRTPVKHPPINSSLLG